MQCLDLEMITNTEKNPWIKIQYFIFFSPKKQATQN